LTILDELCATGRKCLVAWTGNPHQDGFRLDISETTYLAARQQAMKVGNAGDPHIREWAGGGRDGWTRYLLPNGTTVQLGWRTDPSQGDAWSITVYPADRADLVAANLARWVPPVPLPVPAGLEDWEMALLRGES